MLLLEIARRRPVWWYVGTCVLAAVFRLAVLPVQSLDFHQFLSYWWTAAGADPAHALTGNVQNYDYTPVYIAIMVLAHPLLGGLAPVVAIKLISIAGDVACALLVRGIVRHFRPDPAYGRAAFAVVLLLPAVIIDSSAIGQVDSLYTALLLGCVLAVLRRRDGWALIAFGLALAFKFQAVFLAPALAALVLAGVIKWRHLWIAPAATLVAFIPAMTAGRSLVGVLGTYTSQAGEYPFLTLGAPSVYAWWQEPSAATYSIDHSASSTDSTMAALTAAFPRVGHDTILVLTACAMIPCALLVLLVWRRRLALTSRPSRDWVLLLCAVSSVLVPFVLPSMHDRYFYPSSLLVVALAFVVPTRGVRVAAALIVVASTIAYVPGLFSYQGHALPLGFLGMGVFAGLLILLRVLVRASRPTHMPRHTVRMSSASPFGRGRTVQVTEAEEATPFLVSGTAVSEL